MRKIIFGLMFISCSIFAEDNIKKLDWNDKELTWHSYEKGMAKIKESKKPGLLIFYADWCSTCKEYSGLFANKKVIKSLQNLVLIRVDSDAEEEIEKKYNFDGEYVPKTFALNNKGQVIQKFYSKEEEYAYFIPSDDPDYLSQFAQLVKIHGK
tara:strand:+ start:132 stop:590 length:459 start_codon:yes stop_codon:yes gene_type:complete